jgi:cobalt-precorrin 5A hydrolase
MSDPVLSELRVVLVAITKHGAKQVAALAPVLPNAHIVASEKVAAELGAPSNHTHIYTGAMKDEIAALFAHYDQIVFFVSLGVVVRMIAPYLKSKDEDPGILVVDDAGQYVIPVLSGHVGGANSCAEQLADLLGATPIVTTASDVGKTIPVDILGRGLGWKLEAPKINVTRVSADVVNGELIAFVQEAGSKHWWTRPTPLPDTIHLFEKFSDVDLKKYKSVLWVTHAEVPSALWETLHEHLIVYRPPAGQT